MRMLTLAGVWLTVAACMPTPPTALAGSDISATTTTAPAVEAPEQPETTMVVAQTDEPPPLIRSLPQPPPVLDDSLARREDVQAFIRRMTSRHGFDPQKLTDLFSRAQAQPRIIEAITRPAEAKPWHEYRDIFLVPRRIRGGVSFWREHADTLARAERVHGVPAQIIVAIIGVETLYGGNTGSWSVLEALSTLAFDYPRRSDFFTKELENYLLLTRDEGIDPLSLKGSYAGAMGLGQFMPSSYRAYAVDFDGDDIRNLWTNPVDAIGSVANYLAEHRWRAGEPIAVPARVTGQQYRQVLDKGLKPDLSLAQLARYGVEPANDTPAADRDAILLELEGDDGPQYWLGFDNFYVITRYNRSPLYAMAVYQLSQAIRRQYQAP